MAPSPFVTELKRVKVFKNKYVLNQIMNRLPFIETDPNYTRVEEEVGMPEYLKELVPDLNAKFIVGISSGYIARVNIVENVYLETFIKLRGVSIGINPEFDYNLNLPLQCDSALIADHLSLKIEKEKNLAWIYKGRSALTPFEIDELAEQGEDPETLIYDHEPIYSFLESIEFEGEDFDGIDFNQYLDTGLFASVSLEDYISKIDALKDYFQENNYFDICKTPDPEKN